MNKQLNIIKKLLGYEKILCFGNYGKYGLGYPSHLQCDNLQKGRYEYHQWDKDGNKKIQYIGNSSIICPLCKQISKTVLGGKE